MKTRDDFRFVLLPWEHHGADFDARPDFVATAFVGGFEQLFLLKVRANRVFFRFAEDAERVWDTMNTIEGEVVSFWQQAVEQGRFGRLFMRTASLRADWDITMMAALVSDDGSALLCEWCSDVWWQAEPSTHLEQFARTRRHINLWHILWQPSLRQLMANNRTSICNRVMPVAEREATHNRWARGSEEELDRLLRLFCIVHAPIANHAFPASGVVSFSSRGSWAGQDACLLMRHTHELKRVPILDVFAEHNHTWGVTWQTWASSRSQERRRDWRLLVAGQMMELAKVDPSFHQQLEARLLLRDWLRDKAPAEQIETWLASSSQT